MIAKIEKINFISDVNECPHNNGSCLCESDSQCGAVCINTLGSYHCSCSDGYTLAEVMRTCVAKEKVETITLCSFSICN